MLECSIEQLRSSLCCRKSSMMSTATISVSRATFRDSLSLSAPAAILSVACVSRARCSLDKLCSEQGLSRIWQ